MREGAHSGSLWAVASTPLFCSHFHKAWRGGWRSYIGVADRAGGGLSVCFPYRGPAAAGSIAWKTGCRGSLSSSSGRRRGSTIHLSSCCEAERQGSGDPTLCGGYPGPPCSRRFHLFLFRLVGYKKSCAHDCDKSAKYHSRSSVVSLVDVMNISDVAAIDGCVIKH